MGNYKGDLLLSFKGKNFILPSEKISLSFKHDKKNKKEITGTINIKVKKPKTSELIAKHNLKKGIIGNEK